MASYSIDPKIKIRLCPKLKEVSGQEIIEVDQLRNLKGQVESFHELISKCELILPEPRLAPRNPELEARVQRLKKEQEQREYEKMTDNVDTFRQTQKNVEKPISKQLEEINRYLLLIFQFVLSILSAFAFGYLAPYYLYGTHQVGPRLLYGIIFGFVVGLADLYFVIRHLLETEGVISSDKIKMN